MESKNNMYIREITEISSFQEEQLEKLLMTLSPNRTLDRNDLHLILSSDESFLYGLFDGELLIGCCCLGIYTSITGKKACLEDVVVTPEYQGKGGGRMLVDFAAQEAQKKGVKQLLFTSKPSRVQANRLYQSMGFEKKETNVYVRKW